MENTVTSVTALPDWLQLHEQDNENNENNKNNHSNLPLSTTSNRKSVVRDLELTTYGNAFEGMMEKLSRGQSLASIIEEDQRQLDYAAILRWIHKDPLRKARYHEAQEIGAELIAGEMLKIADAENSLEDVQRSTLRINTRKYLLGVWNRRRYGEVKQLEHTGTISITQALQEAQNRVFQGYATVEEIDNAETDIQS